MSASPYLAFAAPHARLRAAGAFPAPVLCVCLFLARTPTPAVVPACPSYNALLHHPLYNRRDFQRLLSGCQASRCCLLFSVRVLLLLASLSQVPSAFFGQLFSDDCPANAQQLYRQIVALQLT